MDALNDSMQGAIYCAVRPIGLAKAPAEVGGKVQRTARLLADRLTG